jgi:hypothetical protein
MDSREKAASSSEGALRTFRASYRAPPLTMHAVYPQTQHHAVKVRLFIDFLARRFVAFLRESLGK